MSLRWSITGRGVAAVALAVALLTAVSALTLNRTEPTTAVPDQLYDGVVVALWATAGLALLVGALPVFRRRVGDSRWVSLLTATVMLGSLFANAASLGDEVARFPQSYTSLLGAALALAAATVCALSIATGESGDHSKV